MPENKNKSVSVYYMYMPTNYPEVSCIAARLTQLKSSKVAQTHTVTSSSQETGLIVFASTAEALELEGRASHDHQLLYT